MVFFFVLWLALWWKNLVFLSPAESHKDLGHCLQKTSSWCINSLTSLLNNFIHSRFGAYPCFTSSSSSLCFSVRRAFVLLKVDLPHATSYALYLLIFLKRQYIGLPDGWVWIHESRTTSSHSGWATHFSSNRWSFCFLHICWWCMGFVLITIGLWSEYDALKCLTLAIGYNLDHFREAHALSSLSSTKASPSRPFCHMYMYPL